MAWPKSLVGFSVTSYGKIQTHFLANPVQWCHLQRYRWGTRKEQGGHVTITIPRLEERKEEEGTGTQRANTMQQKPCKKEQRLSLRLQSVSSKFSQRGIQGNEYTKLILWSWLPLAQPNQAREPIAVVHLGQPPGTEERKEEEWTDIKPQVETIWHSFKGNFTAQNIQLSC